MPGEGTADAVTVEFFDEITWKIAEITAAQRDGAIRVASRDHSVIAPDAFPSVRRRVSQMREDCRRLGRAFGNGRAAENLVRAACTERDRRIGDMLATAEDMTLLLARDFDNAQV